MSIAMYMIRYDHHSKRTGDACADLRQILVGVNATNAPLHAIVRALCSVPTSPFEAEACNAQLVRRRAVRRTEP